MDVIHEGREEQSVGTSATNSESAAGSDASLGVGPERDEGRPADERSVYSFTQPKEMAMKRLRILKLARDRVARKAPRRGADSSDDESEDDSSFLDNVDIGDVNLPDYYTFLADAPAEDLAAERARSSTDAMGANADVDPLYDIHDSALSRASASEDSTIGDAILKESNMAARMARSAGACSCRRACVDHITLGSNFTSTCSALTDDNRYEGARKVGMSEAVKGKEGDDSVDAERSSSGPVDTDAGVIMPPSDIRKENFPARPPPPSLPGRVYENPEQSMRVVSFGGGEGYVHEEAARKAREHPERSTRAVPFGGGEGYVHEEAARGGGDGYVHEEAARKYAALERMGEAKSRGWFRSSSRTTKLFVLCTVFLLIASVFCVAVELRLLWDGRVGKGSAGSDEVPTNYREGKGRDRTADGESPSLPAIVSRAPSPPDTAFEHRLPTSSPTVTESAAREPSLPLNSAATAFAPNLGPKLSLTNIPTEAVASPPDTAFEHQLLTSSPTVSESVATEPSLPSSSATTAFAPSLGPILSLTNIPTEALASPPDTAFQHRLPTNSPTVTESDATEPSLPSSSAAVAFAPSLGPKPSLTNIPTEAVASIAATPVPSKSPDAFIYSTSVITSSKTTDRPTSTPTTRPTFTPSGPPTSGSAAETTRSPSQMPTEGPAAKPSEAPAHEPTSQPTTVPPTPIPTEMPIASRSPTAAPPSPSSEPTSPARASTRTVMLRATGDTYINHTRRFDNYGAADYLLADRSPRAWSFISFDTASQLQGSRLHQDLVSAKLRLYTVDEGGGAAFFALPNAKQWPEGDLTWDNKEQVDTSGQFRVAYSEGFNKDRWYELDVGEAFQQNAGSGVVRTFLIKSVSRVAFASRERSSGRFGPELVLIFSSGSSLHPPESPWSAHHPTASTDPPASIPLKNAANAGYSFMVDASQTVLVPAP